MKFCNHKREKIYLLLSAFTIVGLLAGCHGNYSPEDRADWVTKKINSKLDLNDTQKAKLDDVRRALMESYSKNKAERESSLSDIKAMILADQLDATKAKKMVEKRNRLIEQEFDHIFAKVTEFHASLEPEQKHKAVELIEKYQSKRRYW